MVAPRLSIILPAYQEGELIIPGLQKLLLAIGPNSEVIVVVDSQEDSTVLPVKRLAESSPNLMLLVNDYGRGPANAIRYAIDKAKSDVVIVTMADGCDDPRQVEELAHLVSRGVVVAAASRYMPGGQQVGGPRMKRFLSRFAGKSFALLTGVGTKDATNSFKGYSKDFIRRVGIDSRHGFEIGLELTAKARRSGLPVAEIPTTWIDRSFGKSNFQLTQWIPKYLGWYLYGIGLPHPDSVVRKAIKIKERH